MEVLLLLTRIWRLTCTEWLVVTSKWTDRPPFGGSGYGQTILCLVHEHLKRRLPVFLSLSGLWLGGMLGQVTSNHLTLTPAANYGSFLVHLDMTANHLVQHSNGYT